MADKSEPKHFGVGDRANVQAQQIWLVLVANVMCSKRDAKRPWTITYGDLAKLMGRDPRAGRNLRLGLGVVGAYCKLNDLPTLNSIVVNEKTGAPGDHVVVREGRTAAKEQIAAMKEDWFSHRVPTTGAFRTAWTTAKKKWGADQW